MILEHREKLIFCTGVLSGLGWLVKDGPTADALQSVQEDIETLLKEDFEGLETGDDFVAKILNENTKEPTT